MIKKFYHEEIGIEPSKIMMIDYDDLTTAYLKNDGGLMCELDYWARFLGRSWGRFLEFFFWADRSFLSEFFAGVF